MVLAVKIAIGDGEGGVQQVVVEPEGWIGGGAEGLGCEDAAAGEGDCEGVIVGHGRRFCR